MAIGVILALSLSFFSSAAFAATDTNSPWVIKIDPRDINEPETVDVDADYMDLESGIEVAEVVLEVPDAIVSSCTKTANHVKCKATRLTHGDHDAVVKVKDKSGNTTSSSKRFRYDKISPVIDSLAAGASGVSVKFHDPDPSSGIASVVVTVDGAVLNCRAGGGGCDDDHDGYDHDHDGYDQDVDSYDDDHDGYDQDLDGNDIDHKGYYEDSTGSHESDGYFRDGDNDHAGSGSTGYTCPILGDLGCGSHQVVVTITDKAGNVTAGTAMIDNGPCDLVPPVTTDDAPAGWRNADVTLTLVCADNAGGRGCASTTYELDGGATQAGNSVSLTADGIHTITYRSTDNAGNVEATKTAIVMIDKTPPLLTLPADITQEGNLITGATVAYAASASDAISGAVPVNCSPASGTTFTTGFTTVTCTATDAVGNVVTGYFMVTVFATAPDVQVPADITVEATGPAGTGVIYTATATDPDDAVAYFDCSPASGLTFPVGTTQVTCTAQDTHGNSRGATFNVNVVDATPPVLTLPPDFTIAAPGTTSAVGIFSATATDLVDGDVPVTCSASSGDSFPIGNTTVSCTATDGHGNSSSGSFVITVCQAGRPLLEMICPTVFGAPDWYWKDKAAGIMTIRFDIVNGAGTDAFNVKINGSTATNGVTTLTPMPIAVGDLVAGTSIKVPIDYRIPAGVRSMTVANTACADDGCGTTYYYPVSTP